MTEPTPDIEPDDGDGGDDEAHPANPEHALTAADAAALVEKEVG